MGSAAPAERTRLEVSLRLGPPRTPSPVAFCLVLSVLCGVSDGIPVWRAEGALLSLGVVIVDVALGLGFGAALFGTLALLQRMRARLPGWSVAALGLLLTFAACSFIIRPLGRAAEEAYWAAAALAALLLWGGGFLGLRLLPQASGIALALVAGGSAVALDLWVERTLYTEFHAWFEWCAASCLTVALSHHRAFHAAAAVRAVRAGALVLLPLALWLGSDSQAVARAGWLHGRWLPSLSGTPRPLLDFDGDGFSPWLWGGDCNDSDARIYPGAPDPADGRDRNCNGVIDVADEPLARGLGPDAGDAAFAPGAIDRVVLVTLDTFRPELLREDVMPHTARFFAQGARFERSYANATSTALSLPYFTRADGSTPTLDELLGQAGIAMIRESHRVQSLLDALKEKGGERVFAWMHLDPLHAPYVLWPGFETPPELPPLPRAYVSEAAHVDAELARLWDWLADPERAGRSLVILSSDHGEGAGEHGVFGHTRAAWEEIVRVPLALRGPDIDPGVRPGLATTRSVPATVLGAFGLGREAHAAERFGRSLLRRRRSDGAPGERFVIVETSRAASGAAHSGAMAVVVHDDSTKLVLGLHDRLPQLFHLRTDPDERTDLATRRPAALRAALEAFARAEDLGGIRAQPTRDHYFEVAGR